MIAVSALVVATHTTATAISSEEPDRRGTSLFAADQRGRLLELADDGSIERVIASAAATGGQVGGLAVAPDRLTLWFARHDPLRGLPCDSTIAEVATEGGAARTVATGFAPAASPTGDRIAYVRTQATGHESCSYAVAVQDLGTGEELVWPLDASWAEAYGICSVAWTPEGERLVAEACVEADVVLHTVDVEEPGTIGDDTFLGPEDADRSWAMPASGRRADEVVVVEYCCLSRGAAPPDVSVYVHDAVTGERVRTLDALADDVDSIAALDADPSGRRLLYVAYTNAQGGGTRLYRYDRTGEPIPLRDGIVAAAW